MEKISCFREKIPSFQIMQGKSCPGAALFQKTIFSERLKKISYFLVFFWERSSFIFRLRGKIIFSGERNIIFPNNTRKIIFQRDFFGKTILSGRLEKENMVFRAVSATDSIQKEALQIKWVLFLLTIRMSQNALKFDNISVNKKEFHKSKQPVS